MPKEFEEHNQYTDKEEKKDRINRRSLLKRGGLAAGMISFASALGLTPFSPAQAAAIQQSQSNVKVEILTKQEAAAYFQATLASSDYQQFKQKVAQQYGGVFTVDEQQFTAMALTDGQQNMVIVRIPIGGGAGYSFYSTSFNQGSQAIVSPLWGLFTFTSSNDINAVVTRDGTTLFEGVLTPNGAIKQGTASYPDGTKTITGFSPDEAAIPNSFWSCMGNCLNSQGVAGWIIALLSIICGLLCIGIPTTCISCLVDQLGIAGVVAAYCVGKCWGQ